MRTRSGPLRRVLGRAVSASRERGPNASESGASPTVQLAASCALEDARYRTAPVSGTAWATGTSRTRSPWTSRRDAGS